MASASAELDIELESFITTLYTCEAAVYLDTIPSRKQMLKKYLFLRVYQSQEYARLLDLLNQKRNHTDGQAIEEICQNYWRTLESKSSI